MTGRREMVKRTIAAYLDVRPEAIQDIRWQRDQAWVKYTEGDTWHSYDRHEVINRYELTLFAINNHGLPL